MFTDAFVREVVAAAQANGIRPAGLLALIEVETAGKPFEADGRTPSLLYERHVAYREAKKRSQGLLARFVRAGLAIPKWNRSTQYKDERTSAQRLALIAKARSIDEDVALRSCSWGLGQIMGFHAEELGFESAAELVKHMTGSIAGQVDCLIRVLRKQHLIEPLNSKDYKHVARLYNGSGYAQNRYDTRLMDADKRWERKLSTMGHRADPKANVPPPPEQSLPKEVIRIIQQDLRDLGYPQVGMVDGFWGANTIGAISAFQAHEGLPVTGHYDDATHQAMLEAQARALSEDRASATANDLRNAGSPQIETGDKVSTLGKMKMLGSAGSIGGLGAAKLLDDAQEHLDKVDQATTILGRVKAFVPHIPPDVLITAGVIGVVVLVVGFLVWRHGERIKALHVSDFNSGLHSGYA